MEKVLYAVKVKLADYNDYDCIVGWDIERKYLTEEEVQSYIDDMNEFDDEGIDIELLFSAYPRYTNPVNADIGVPFMPF